MGNGCKKCGKKIFYATVCPYCGTIQTLVNLAKSIQMFFINRYF